MSQPYQRLQQRQGCLRSQWHSVFWLKEIASNRAETSGWRPNILSCARHVIREHRCGAIANGKRSNKIAGFSIGGANMYLRRLSSDLSRSFVPEECVHACATGSAACKASAHCLYGSLWTNGDLHHGIFLATAWLTNLASPSVRAVRFVTLESARRERPETKAK